VGSSRVLPLCWIASHKARQQQLLLIAVTGKIHRFNFQVGKSDTEIFRFTLLAILPTEIPS